MDEILLRALFHVSLENQGINIQDLATLVSRDFDVPADESLKKFLWDELVSSEDVSQLRKEGSQWRPITDRRSFVTFDGAKGSADLLENIRFLASQELRYASMGITGLELADLQVQVVTHLAHARLEGIRQPVMGDLLKTEPRTLFYHLKRLETSGVIVRRQIYVKNQDIPGVQMLLHLKTVVDRLEKTAKETASYLANIEKRDQFLNACDRQASIIITNLEKATDQIMSERQCKMLLDLTNGRKDKSHWERIRKRVQVLGDVERVFIRLDSRIPIPCLHLCSVQNTDTTAADMRVGNALRGLSFDLTPVEVIYRLVAASGKRGVTVNQICKRIGLERKMTNNLMIEVLNSRDIVAAPTQKGKTVEFRFLLSSITDSGYEPMAYSDDDEDGSDDAASASEEENVRSTTRSARKSPATKTPSRSNDDDNNSTGGGGGGGGAAARRRGSSVASRGGDDDDDDYDGEAAIAAAAAASKKQAASSSKRPQRYPNKKVSYNEGTEQDDLTELQSQQQQKDSFQTSQKKKKSTASSVQEDGDDPNDGDFDIGSVSTPVSGRIMTPTTSLFDKPPLVERRQSAKKPRAVPQVAYRQDAIVRLLDKIKVCFMHEAKLEIRMADDAALEDGTLHSRVTFDKKTLSRLCSSLAREGKISMVKVALQPSVTVPVLMHKDVNMSDQVVKDALDEYHVRLSAARKKQLLMSTSAVEVPSEVSDRLIKNKPARPPRNVFFNVLVSMENGFIYAKLIRIRILHLFLCETFGPAAAKNVNDGGNPVKILNGRVVFSVKDVLKSIPIVTYLQIIGLSVESSEFDWPTLRKENLPLGSLPFNVQEFLLNDSAGHTRAISLLQLGARMHFLSTFSPDDEEVKQLLPSDNSKTPVEERTLYAVNQRYELTFSLDEETKDGEGGVLVGGEGENAKYYTASFEFDTPAKVHMFWKLLQSTATRTWLKKKEEAAALAAAAAAVATPTKSKEPEDDFFGAKPPSATKSKGKEEVVVASSPFTSVLEILEKANIPVTSVAAPPPSTSEGSSQQQQEKQHEQNEEQRKEEAATGVAVCSVSELNHLIPEMRAIKQWAAHSFKPLTSNQRRLIEESRLPDGSAPPPSTIAKLARKLSLTREYIYMQLYAPAKSKKLAGEDVEDAIGEEQQQDQQEQQEREGEEGNDEFVSSLLGTSASLEGGINALLESRTDAMREWKSGGGPVAVGSFRENTFYSGRSRGEAQGQNAGRKNDGSATKPRARPKITPMLKGKPISRILAILECRNHEEEEQQQQQQGEEEEKPVIAEKGDESGGEESVGDEEDEEDEEGQQRHQQQQLQLDENVGRLMKRKRWTKAEDERLLAAISQCKEDGKISWVKVLEVYGKDKGVTRDQIRRRYSTLDGWNNHDLLTHHIEYDLPNTLEETLQTYRLESQKKDKGSLWHSDNANYEMRRLLTVLLITAVTQPHLQPESSDGGEGAAMSERKIFTQFIRLADSAFMEAKRLMQQVKILTKKKNDRFNFTLTGGFSDLFVNSHFNTICDECSAFVSTLREKGEVPLDNDWSATMGVTSSLKGGDVAALMSLMLNKEVVANVPLSLLTNSDDATSKGGGGGGGWGLDDADEDGAKNNSSNGGTNNNSSGNNNNRWKSQSKRGGLMHHLLSVSNEAKEEHRDDDEDNDDEGKGLLPPWTPSWTVVNSHLAPEGKKRRGGGGGGSGSASSSASNRKRKMDLDDEEGDEGETRGVRDENKKITDFFEKLNNGTLQNPSSVPSGEKRKRNDGEVETEEEEEDGPSATAAATTETETSSSSLSNPLVDGVKKFVENYGVEGVSEIATIECLENGGIAAAGNVEKAITEAINFGLIIRVMCSETARLVAIKFAGFWQLGKFYSAENFTSHKPRPGAAVLSPFVKLNGEFNSEFFRATRRSVVSIVFAHPAISLENVQQRLFGLPPAAVELVVENLERDGLLSSKVVVSKKPSLFDDEDDDGYGNVTIHAGGRGEGVRHLFCPHDVMLRV